MDTSEAVNEFMRRLGKNGITGCPSNVKAATTTRLDANLTKNLATQLPNSTIIETKALSRLFNLPGELRNQIWRDVLISPTGFIRPLRSGFKEESKIKLDFHVVDPKAHPKYTQYVGYVPGEQIHLSLLITNKQTNRECEYIFWEKNKFILQQDDICMSPTLLCDNALSPSSCGKIKLLQLDIDIRFSQLAIQAQLEGNRTLETALTIVEKMAEKGALKELSIKPISCLQTLEEIIDAATEMRDYQDEVIRILAMFGELNEGKLKNVKRTVEVDVRWAEWRAVSHPQELWVIWARFLLNKMAECMGGSKGKMWVDGKLCFENIEGKPEARADPFPSKTLEEKKMHITI